MKKPGKYLKFYINCINDGVMPRAGLCNNLDKGVSLFAPSYDERLDLYNNKFSTTYWGSGLKWNDLEDRKYLEFTALRQNIVLFLAAINNEL